jgi:hypothetical protein
MNTTLQAKNDPKHPDFAYKINNSGLRSLLSIRNLTNSVEKHMEQLTKIESDMRLIYNNSLTLFQTYNAEGDHEHWENALSDINDYQLSKPKGYTKPEDVCVIHTFLMKSYNNMC